MVVIVSKIYVIVYKEKVQFDNCLDGCLKGQTCLSLLLGNGGQGRTKKQETCIDTEKAPIPGPISYGN